MGKSADATHTMQCFSIPSLSLCLRCAIPYEMMVDKQGRYDIFIVPAIKNNNIAVFIGLLYDTVQYDAKTWLQKKESR